MSTTSKATIDAVRAALSTQRMRTYEYEVEIKSQKTADDSAAIKLYAWNAAVSGALMAPPLHLCEVVVRNAVSDAIEAVYGSRWPWSPTFELSLPDTKPGYSQRYDLQSSRRSEPTTGKVIPELKFVFWQKMFTNRYDSRIWNHHLRRVMPNLDKTKNITVLRQSVIPPFLAAAKSGGITTGRTDIEIEISNQCARLIANAIIYYNSAILSKLLTKVEASGNTKAMARIAHLSPAAWRHILLNGHYTFQGTGKPIDLDALVFGLDLG